MDKFKEISESTLLPISFVIILFGFVAWLTNLHANTTANGGDITEIKQSQIIYNDKLDQVLEKLNRIEGFLKRGPHDEI